jgi:hypothetical protein
LLIVASASAVAYFGYPIREIESGKEIQEGKARRRVSQEEGDEEGEAGQESKG